MLYQAELRPVSTLVRAYRMTVRAYELALLSLLSSLVRPSPLDQIADLTELVVPGQMNGFS